MKTKILLCTAIRDLTILDEYGEDGIFWKSWSPEDSTDQRAVCR